MAEPAKRASRRAGVEAEHDGCQGHQREDGDDLDEREDAVAPAGANIDEKLGSRRKAQGKDEQGEGGVLEVVADRDAQLSDGQRHKKRAADATKLNRPDAEAPNQMSEGNGQEECRRRVGKKTHKSTRYELNDKTSTYGIYSRI